MNFEMVKKLLLATHNQHKVEELQDILCHKGWQVVSLADFPDFVMPEEDGDSFLANATIKAKAAYKYTGILSMADDSGIEVDYLHGAPGIFSARFAGNDADNNAKLLKLLEGVPRSGRTARFHCVIALAGEDNMLLFTEGTCGGEVALKPSGTGGFGYDAVFYMPQYGCTMADLSHQEKNIISHRSIAMQKILPLLENLLE